MAGGEIVGDEKPSQDLYPSWLHHKFRVALQTEKLRYQRESIRIKSAVEASDTWKDYLSEKANLADRYYAKTTYRLFVDNEVEEILVKPWTSFLEKTYRSNVTNNSNWPAEPPDGWVLPDNWYERTHDIARTSIIVKYLDGVTTLADYFTDLTARVGVGDFTCTFEARDTGYYAAHARIGVDYKLLRADWTEVETRGQFEVQVTTQLQEVIRRLTHNTYEKRRVESTGPELKWQWDYESESFKPNYLGHLLHYLEGMIMEVRDKGRKDV